ncbi:MAG TPA: GntR family transcriptional regulator [Streptosporangiaceae bacterium]
MSEIDPLGPVPLSQQLAAVLRRQIKDGELVVGRPVPSQRSLVQEYGLARGTVARAVAILVEEGLVVIVPGKGAYVRPKSG